MRTTPRFASAGFVKASVAGLEFETRDISEKGVKLTLRPDHPFRIGEEYIVYLFISERRDSQAQSAWSVMGECRWIEDGAAGFAFTSNSFIEREINKILINASFDKVSEPGSGR
jgi:hypothetical protein